MNKQVSTVTLRTPQTRCMHVQAPNGPPLRGTSFPPRDTVMFFSRSTLSVFLVRYTHVTDAPATLCRDWSGYARAAPTPAVSARGSYTPHQRGALYDALGALPARLHLRHGWSDLCHACRASGARRRASGTP